MASPDGQPTLAHIRTILIRTLHKIHQATIERSQKHQEHPESERLSIHRTNLEIFSKTINMKAFTRMTAIALLSLPSALAGLMPTRVDVGAPDKVQQEVLCTATLVGVSSEGGGGPGQAPIVSTVYYVNVVGPSGTINGSCSGGGSSAANCDTVSASTYGGTFDTTCSGNWNGGSNSWNACTCNTVGGAVLAPHIDGGTVT